jgi:hypothetical protein
MPAGEAACYRFFTFNVRAAQASRGALRSQDVATDRDTKERTRAAMDVDFLPGLSPNPRHEWPSGPTEIPKHLPKIEVCAPPGGAESAKNVVTGARQERKVALTVSGCNAPSLRSRLSGQPACSLTLRS